MAWENLDEERLKTIVRQLTGKITEKDTAVPQAMIKGSGELFCYCPSKRAFVMVQRGSMVYIIDNSTDNKGRILIYYNYEVLAIEKHEVIEIGFD